MHYTTIYKQNGQSISFKYIDIKNKSFDSR